MAKAINSETRGSGPRQFAGVQPRFVGCLFAALMVVHALGFLVLGIGRSGLAFSEIVLSFDTLLAIACAGIAYRRARGVIAIFWFLFVIDLVVLLVPTVIEAYENISGQIILSESICGLLYSLYGAPILMMLFLPEANRRGAVKFEIFLDLFQIGIVVALVYSTFFFLPVQRMLPDEALPHNISVSDWQSVALLIAALLRLQFVHVPGTRDRLRRLALFLFVCAVATPVGDWFYLQHNTTGMAWFDLGWAVPQIVAAWIALTWKPAPETESASQPHRFPTFLASNLVLVAMLSLTALLMNQWTQADGALIARVAIAASLLASTFRLAFTQFHQQQEIAQRMVAQTRLAESNEEIRRLLRSARRQTTEITQISELGSLLLACASFDEVFRLIPERLRHLFPESSGSVALMSPSRNRVETAAKWGICPEEQLFSPDQCWALRRGRTHIHPGGHSDPRCSHLLGEGASVCIPLIANGEAMGTLSLQQDMDLPRPSDLQDADADARRHQLAAAVAEHLSLALANLNLRETLRLQAVRDSLTGLYNRRYMQEFLDRELHAARRKQRSVAVMMLDLDHFKRYNDNFGHSAGDKALAAVGEALLRSVRAEDVACRYGGEEFALILPECSLKQAMIRAEEIRRRVKECPLRRDQEPTEALTVSIGVAAFDETTDRVDLILKCADEALYEAKRQGRNRVVQATPVAALLDTDQSDPIPVRAEAPAVRGA